MDYANEGTLYKLINNAIEKNEFISNAIYITFTIN